MRFSLEKSYAKCHRHVVAYRYRKVWLKDGRTQETLMQDSGKTKELIYEDENIEVWDFGDYIAQYNKPKPDQMVAVLYRKPETMTDAQNP